MLHAFFILKRRKSFADEILYQLFFPPKNCDFFHCDSILLKTRKLQLLMLNSCYKILKKDVLYLAR